MQIVGISGKRGSGKDTLAARFIARGWAKLSFASTLKAHVREFFDMTIEQTDGALKETVDSRYGVTPRQIMIDVGQFYRRFDPLFWVKKATSKLDSEGKYIVSDLRFINEANHLRSMGASLVRLNRRRDLNIYKEEINDISETELDNYEHFDVVVPEDKNVNLGDLEVVAATVCKESVCQ